MNEPPGARMRVGLTGLTMAEYFRDKEHKDVLLFIDNIFRFIQPAPKFRLCSAVSRRPLATSRHWAPTSAPCRNALRRPKTVLSRPSRLFTSLPTTSRTGSGCYLRAPRCDDGSVPSDRRTGDLPGRRSLGLHVAYPRPEHHRRRSLPDGPCRTGNPPEVQRPAGYHRHPGYRRIVRRR